MYSKTICINRIKIDSWTSGKKSLVEPPSNLGLILEHITVLAEVWILNLSTLYINCEMVGYLQKKSLELIATCIRKSILLIAFPSYCHSLFLIDSLMPFE
jgi:hypothetical protein